MFVDIGDKSWGVLVCQNYFGAAGLNGDGESIRGERTLHVGDQFLSAGSNDFKARVVGTTAWIANPAETVELLDELKRMMEQGKEGAVKEGDGLETDLLARVDMLFEKHPMPCA